MKYAWTCDLLRSRVKPWHVAGLGIIALAVIVLPTNHLFAKLWLGSVFAFLVSNFCEVGSRLRSGMTIARALDIGIGANPGESMLPRFLAASLLSILGSGFLIPMWLAERAEVGMLQAATFSAIEVAQEQSAVKYDLDTGALNAIRAMFNQARIVSANRDPGIDAFTLRITHSGRVSEYAAVTPTREPDDVRIAFHATTAWSHIAVPGLGRFLREKGYLQ